MLVGAIPSALYLSHTLKPWNCTIKLLMGNFVNIPTSSGRRCLPRKGLLSKHVPTYLLQYTSQEITMRKNKHEFTIYRKSTTTNNVIHNQSNHPVTQKEAYFRFLLHRLLRTPMTKPNTHRSTGHRKTNGTIKWVWHKNCGRNTQQIRPYIEMKSPHKEMKQRKKMLISKMVHNYLQQQNHTHGGQHAKETSAEHRTHNQEHNTE